MLERLHAEGVRTIMLTGDRRAAAEQVAKDIGLDEVRAGLKPEDKVAAIKAMTDAGEKVAMVGDGVNDAPSLAAAYVSVAMGARGSDAALEQSDVVLMQDRIEKLLTARELSLKAGASSSRTWLFPWARSPWLRWPPFLLAAADAGGAGA
ncbi:HAD-IC family P-type ATPase [Verrucomicrobium spinosum]|uniref:HAD-IC family P-type ATPase n=1 Tax=Verrucomicrobium spinosum TaxID=2736 RepID=UPI00210B3D01|nr:HAD-IC family P-type ATPase [Verrucomicrobium spinosum]